MVFAADEEIPPIPPLLGVGAMPPPPSTGSSPTGPQYATAIATSSHHPAGPRLSTWSVIGRTIAIFFGSSIVSFVVTFVVASFAAWLLFSNSGGWDVLASLLLLIVLAFLMSEVLYVIAVVVMARRFLPPGQRMGPTVVLIVGPLLLMFTPVLGLL